MCDELQDGSLPLLIATPNGRDESGANRDCLVFDPQTTDEKLKMFKFLGKLFIDCSMQRHLHYELGRASLYLVASRLPGPSLVALG